MTAPEVGAHRSSLDAAVRSLTLQVNRETVLKARAVEGVWRNPPPGEHHRDPVRWAE